MLNTIFLNNDRYIAKDGLAAEVSPVIICADVSDTESIGEEEVLALDSEEDYSEEEEEVNEDSVVVEKEPNLCWVCPVCQHEWLSESEQWLGCDFCSRCWHKKCMPTRMVKEAQSSLRKSEKWRCWPCTSVMNSAICVNVCVKCRKKENVKSEDDWVV